MTTILAMKNISKAFSTKPIYINTSFDFKKGCYAIVGPNGAGKTILLEMLAGVLQQDNGSIIFSDTDLNTSIEYKQKLVYVPCKSLFFPIATGEEFLSFILSVKNTDNMSCEKLNGLIEDFKLTPHLHSKFKDMSLGTQKKLFLSTLAIGNNSLIILDEPTNGLDKESSELLCEWLIELSKNSIVILTTHDQLLLKAISPTIIKLQSSPTMHFEKHNVYRYDDAEHILQFH